MSRSAATASPQGGLEGHLAVSRASPITSATAMAGLDANGARVFVRHCGHVGQQTGRLAAPASPGRYRDFTAATVIVSEIVLVFFIVIVINCLAG